MTIIFHNLNYLYQKKSTGKKWCVGAEDSSGPLILRLSEGARYFQDGALITAWVCKRYYTGLAYRQPLQPIFGHTAFRARVVDKHTIYYVVSPSYSYTGDLADVNLWYQLL